MTTTTNLSKDNIETSSSIVGKKIDEELSSNNYSLLTTMNNNEVYEKIRPLTNVLKEDQAHGDDPHVEISKDQLQSHKQPGISSIASSSNDFSLEMAMRITDTSNEALKTDDENGMTKSYFISDYNQKENNIILSDVSLQQQQLPNDECEYEIDLGNGWITKSISSYQYNDKQQQRTTSIISADSIQPITTFKIPFTNTFYKQHVHSKQENTIDHYDEPNVLFSSHDNISQPRWPEFSLRTVTIISIGAIITILIITVVFFVV